jgi:maltose O-acetyltransferase
MIGKIALYLSGAAQKARAAKFRKRYAIHADAALGDLHITGKRVAIGKGSYYNSGYISAGNEAEVKIGTWCAIGYNVSIVAATHDVDFPTGPESNRPMLSGNITIGDGVWIGNNVVVLPGCSIGNYAVIGANSVVNSNIPDFAIAAGIPARVIRSKDREKTKLHEEFVQNNR